MLSVKTPLRLPELCSGRRELPFRLPELCSGRRELPFRLPELCSGRRELCSRLLELCSGRRELSSRLPDLCSGRRELCSRLPDLCSGRRGGLSSRRCGSLHRRCCRAAQRVRPARRIGGPSVHPAARSLRIHSGSAPAFRPSPPWRATPERSSLPGTITGRAISLPIIGGLEEYWRVSAEARHRNGAASISAR